MVERADRLYDYAVTVTGCTTPWIAENELFGAQTPTPWTATTAQYRANVLALVRRLAERGARMFVTIANPPYTGDEAAQWWRDLAATAVLVRQVYFTSPNVGGLHARGPVLREPRDAEGDARERQPLHRDRHPREPRRARAPVPLRAGTGRSRGAAAGPEVARGREDGGARRPAGDAASSAPTRSGRGAGRRSARAGSTRTRRRPSASTCGPATQPLRRKEGRRVVVRQLARVGADRPAGRVSSATCRRRPNRRQAVAGLARALGDRDAADERPAGTAGPPGGGGAASASRYAWRSSLFVADRFGGNMAAYLRRDRRGEALARRDAGGDRGRPAPPGRADAVRRRRSQPAGDRVLLQAYSAILARLIAVSEPVGWLGESGAATRSRPSRRERCSAPPGRGRSTDRRGAVRVRPLGDSVPLGSLPLAEVRDAIEVALRRQARATAYDAGWSSRTADAGGATTASATTCPGRRRSTCSHCPRSSADAQTAEARARTIEED